MIETRLDGTELLVFDKLLTNNSIFFDIGARMNFHEYCNINNTHEFHLFEPNPHYYNELIKYINEQKQTTNINVIANNIAISDFVSDAHPYYWHGSESIIDLGRGKLADFTVKVNTMEQYVTDNNITRIDYIKIDTEGSDYSILKSSYDTIKKLKVPYIQFEYWNNMDSFDELLRDDYRLYLLNEPTLASYTGYRTAIIEITPDLISVIGGWIKSGWGGNILAVHKSTKFNYDEYNFEL